MPAKRPKDGSFAAKVGWKSIRGRYLYAASAFVLLLIAAAWFADVRVQHASHRSDSNMVERDSIRRSLRTITNNLRRTEPALQEYLLLPNAKERATLEGLLFETKGEVERLMSTHWVETNPGAHRTLTQLSQLVTAAHKQVNAVMDTRLSPDRTFPAMRPMIERMLPAHRELMRSINSSIDDAVSHSTDPNQVIIYKALSDTRSAAAEMAAIFRLWVVDRLAAGNESATRPPMTSGDIRSYTGIIDKNLKLLSEQARQNRLTAGQNSSLKELQQHYREWLNGYSDVMQLYQSGKWRTDLPMVRDHVRPLFEQAWKNLYAVEASVEVYSVEDMTTLRHTADHLSMAIWLLVVIAAVIVTVGYIFFELNIRRPLVQVASALNAEADGEMAVIFTRCSTDETQDLLFAFDHMRQQVHTRQQRLATILDNAAEGIITFDKNGKIESFNKAAERLFGYPEEEIIGQSIDRLIEIPRELGHSDPQPFNAAHLHRLIGQESETVGRHRDGGTFHLALKISLTELDGREVYTGLAADISERKAMVDHLKNLAERDGLTGLYNRLYFQQELERVVERAHRTQSLSNAVLYIDLDNFKFVNDTLGHAAGDRLLIEVANILHKRARKSDLICRFGGDEFTVLLYDTTPELATHAADSFRKRLANYSFRHDGEQVDIGCSIGVAPISAQTTSAAEALSHADLACHLAKRAGRNQVHTFAPSDAQNVTEMSMDMGWSRRIKNAIETDRFVLASQPIVNTRTGAVETHEVLLRLEDENGKLIMPSGFLPSADRFGLSCDVDIWVIRHAIDLLKQQRAITPNLRYSINLSGPSLSNPQVCDLIEKKLLETGLDPSALTFEVTETVAITDMGTAQSFLARLRKMGCRAALDDFGSGMSSFAYLRDLPVDYVKIDGRFVRNLVNNPVDQAIFRAINDVVHAFGKQTVAEFVENEKIYALIKDYGVDYAQGYHLGRPDMAAPNAKSAGGARSST